MYSTSTAIVQITGILKDSGSMLVLTIGSVFGAGVALMGAGYAFNAIARRLFGVPSGKYSNLEMSGDKYF